MTIPPKVIEIAIHGGWKPPVEDSKNWYRDLNILTETGWKTLADKIIQRNGYEEIALDPKFWQALGKALEWKFIDVGEDVCFLCGAAKYDKVECQYSSKHRYGKDEWRKNARLFFNLILTEQSTEKFWDEIISSVK